MTDPVLTTVLDPAWLWAARLTPLALIPVSWLVTFLLFTWADLRGDGGGELEQLGLLIGVLEFMLGILAALYLSMTSWTPSGVTIHSGTPQAAAHHTASRWHLQTDGLASDLQAKGYIVGGNVQVHGDDSGTALRFDSAGPDGTGSKCVLNLQPATWRGAQVTDEFDCGRELHPVMVNKDTLAPSGWIRDSGDITTHKNSLVEDDEVWFYAVRKGSHTRSICYTKDAPNGTLLFCGKSYGEARLVTHR